MWIGHLNNELKVIFELHKDSLGLSAPYCFSLSPSSWKISIHAAQKISWICSKNFMNWLCFLSFYALKKKKYYVLFCNYWEPIFWLFWFTKKEYYFFYFFEPTKWKGLKQYTFTQIKSFWWWLQANDCDPRLGGFGLLHLFENQQ